MEATGMTDDLTTLRAQLDDANQELYRLREQSLQSLHGLVEDLRTATNSMQADVAQLTLLVTTAQRDTVATRNALEHHMGTVLDLIRSLPCRKQGGNGSVCEHDHRGIEQADTEPPPKAGHLEW